MGRSSTLGKTFTLLLGLFLVVEGIWGLVSPPVFGILPTNAIRASIHLLFGIAGLAAWKTDNVRKYLSLVGPVILAVGVLYFIPFVKELIVGLLAVDRNVAILNVLVGIIALIVARGERHLDPPEPRDRKAYNLPQ